ncbi:hypothetical protein BEL04_12420 [Mucilaginibacter sp. PPCGB 2223]|nr:hypothetical protein BEL04_12420 [Mucilaginibacter sp. PPCGB 2223]
MGCKKDNNPGNSSASKGTLALKSGNSQSGVYGRDLTDSIIVKVTPAAGLALNKYVIKFNMAQGNGQIENILSQFYNGTIGPDGLVRIKWRLGCDNPSQKLVIYLYNSSLINLNTGVATAGPDDSVTVSATGTKPTGWARACGCGTPTYNAKIATFDKKTLYMANNGLYSSADGGINWYKVTNAPNWSSITDVQFNSKGWMYILTNTGVYYTQDQQNWIAINNGILYPGSPTMFMVTDNVLMVSFYSDGPYLSTNNGGFWQKLLVGYGSQRYYLAKQAPNGSIYLFNDWTNFLTSANNGQTWQLISTTGQTVNYAAYDLQIAPDSSIYIGSDNATIANFSPARNQWTYKSYYQYNASTQAVNNIQFYNNKVYFLVNTSPNAGVYNGTVNNYTKINTGFTATISYYFVKPDGTFILGSGDGFYYHN